MKTIITLLFSLFISTYIMAQLPVGMKLWLKADAGVYNDAGVTLSNNGGAVQQWNDQSGNNNHVTQLTQVNKPEFQTGIINGQKSVYFDGVTGIKYMNNTIANLTAAGGARTVFVVGRMDCRAVANGGGPYPTEGGFLITFRRSVLLCGLSIGKNAGTTYINTDGVNPGSNATINNGFIDTSKKPFLATYKLAGAGSRIGFRMNKNDVAVSQSQPVNADNGPTGFTIGDREDLAGADWQGWISELIVYDRLLNATEITSVEDYLYNKYSLDVPTLIGDCSRKLWLKADAAVTYDGSNKVSTWNDVSGHNFNAAQTDNTKQPTWQPYAFNGKPALLFDGVNGNYFLENTVSTPVATAGSARTYFVVAKAACNATGYAGGHLFSNRLTANASTLEFTKNGSSVFHGGNLCCNHPAATNVAFESGQNQPFVGTWRTGGTGTNLDFWFNGTGKTTANANFVADNGTAGFAVGDRRDGQAPVGSYDWQGHIAEIIVYDRALTDAERIAVENYLTEKYITNAITPQFTGLPIASITTSNTDFADATWKHTFNTIDIAKLIVSVKDNCLPLGIINSTVYNDANATLNGGKYTMRRHYVVKPTLSPSGTKRIRLYYTNADFADLQTFDPSLNAAGQLVVTKYDGPNEDGVYDPSGGTLTFIPAALITTGTSFGQNFLEFDVTGFSEFWIHTGSSALPISLSKFTATAKDNISILQWITSSELNNKGYNIQHSTDGVTFTNIGFVNGKGNSTANTNYNFTHYKPSFGKNYYRLQALDFDGKTTLSNIEIVVIKIPKNVISIYPNPASKIINITSLGIIASLELLDITGRKIKSFAGTQSSIDVSMLTNGMYILKVILTSGEKVEEKIMVRK